MPAPQWFRPARRAFKGDDVAHDVAIWKQLINPVIYPVTVEELREHLRLGSDTSQDAYLLRLIKVATRLLENFCQMSFLTQEARLTYQGWGNGKRLYLRRGPIASITQVRYTDTDGVVQTLASTEYMHDLDRDPPTVMQAYSKYFPSTRNVWNSVYVDVVAGVASAAALDPDIPMAVLLVCSEFFQKRSITALRDLTKETFDVLLLMLDHLRNVSIL